MMNLKYKKIWTWDKKILFDDNLLSSYEIEIKNINKNNEYSFYFLERKQFTSIFKHDIFNHVSLKNLNRMYRRDKNLRNFYEKLLNFIIENKIKSIIICHTWQYRHPNFIKKIKELWIKIALSTMDDDYDTIKYCSLPYTKYYDYHFHVWVMYNKKWKTIAEKLKEYWWNPIRIPFWARASHISNIQRKRDIDICYIWNVNPPKILRLSKLKKHFWDRIKFFWRQWNWDRKSIKWILYKFANKLFRLWYIEPISDKKLLEIYSRTKIGFNMHLCPWKWPSNIRMYELPCNWVMQICDNELWLSKIFELDKEVVGYKDINEAIKKIEYYLNHDDERLNIAENWYKRAIKNYTSENRIRKILETMLL